MNRHKHSTFDGVLFYFGIDMEYRLIRCKGCMRTLCKVERNSEINKSFKCRKCGTINHFNGDGHVKTFFEVSDISTSGGKRFL